MSFKIETYERRVFTVAAVLVTDQNMSEVASWCGGELHTKTDASNNESTSYIKIKSDSPFPGRRSSAYAGDWVLKFGDRFRIYNEAAFKRSFVPAKPVQDSGHIPTPSEVFHP